MNVDKLVRVAEWLEAGAPTVGKLAGFNMADTIEYAPFSSATQNDGRHMEHQCGTICCIAGAVVQFELQEIYGEMADNDDAVMVKHEFVVGKSILTTAADIIGIDDDTADRLFVPAGVSLHNATPEQGATVIRELIATGEVNWAQFVHEED
jgi:hypothetical protein